MVFVISFLGMLFAAIAAAFDGDGAGGSSDSGGAGDANSSSDSGAGDGGSSDSGGSDGGKGGDAGDKLDDAGKAALKAERDRADREEKERKKLQKRLEDLEKAQLSDDEKKIAEAKDAGKKEATSEMLSKLVRTTIVARATSKINLKPEYIPGLFNLEDFIEDEDVAVAKIDAAIEKILKDQPHLKMGASLPGKPGPESHNGGKAEPDEKKFAFGHAVKNAWAKGKS